MNLIRLKNQAAALLFVMGLLLSSCRAQAGGATPTLSGDQIETMAVGTYSAGLTSTALVMPSDTPTLSEVPTSGVTSIPVATFVLVTPSNTPAPLATASCYGLTFVSDVTIPDNTSMNPGHKFTKTWRVRNSGACAWEAGWKFKLTGGESMGGSTVALSKAVQPGDQTDLSVDLTAPDTAGTYRGNWRMTTGSGSFFGDEVYVLIVVSGSTSTATAKATSTTGPSATFTNTVAPSDTPTNTPTDTETP